MPLALTSKYLRQHFGSKSHHARETTVALAHCLTTDVPEFALWRETAFAHHKRMPSARPLLKLYGLAENDTAQTIFVLQTYYALIVKLLAAHHIAPGMLAPLAELESGAFFHERGVVNLLDDATAYGWYLGCTDDALNQALASLQRAIGHFDTHNAPPDALKALYHDIFPAQLRHSLGEYYTPDWLAAHVLARVGFAGQQRVLDPACGSGTFLALAARQMRAAGHSQQAMLDNLVGIDVNPLACLSAKVNLLLCIGQPQGAISLPIHCADTILNPPQFAPVDVIVGNPPWINWETLPPTYREKIQHLWTRYGLFPHTGFESILGKGKKDLALLLTYACIDRNLVDGGKLGFLLTKTALKTGGAGAGFRKFMISQTPLRVCSADDFGALKLFPPASTHTIALIIQKGEPTTYPVPYTIWRKGKTHGKLAQSQSLAQARARTRRFDFVAEPISTPTSAWLTGRPAALEAVRQVCGKSDYQAHAGAYTGGANAVYWLDVLERRPDGVRVRNIVEGAKRPVPQIETVLEPDLIFPLLRGRDVKRWGAVPTAHILIVQDPQTRQGYEVAWLRARYPRTLAYLQHFEAMLRQRATYRRYFKPDVPFYSMFDIGPYTLAPVKVVWKGFGTAQMQAAVITRQGDQPIMTNQAMHPFIGLHDEDEAHYLAALLNSAPFEFAVLSHTQTGSKSFAQPGILDDLRLPRYRADDALHHHLASLSQRAHAGYADDDSIAAAAALVWGLLPTQLEDVWRSLDELRG